MALIDGDWIRHAKGCSTVNIRERRNGTLVRLVNR
jgi:hypothetical protein